MNLYLTADRIGESTGGGVVTRHESQALQSLSPDFRSVSRLDLEGIPIDTPEPWRWDTAAYCSFGNRVKLAHIYSGTFSSCVGKMKANGSKVCYTIAAHDREVSKREHERMGWGFNYPHLVEKRLWERYIEGYRLADVIVCPSTVAADTVRRYGPAFEQKRYEIIPHGCETLEVVMPFPAKFTVGYLGSFGPDKGVRYLLEAWKKLNYQDAVLVLAGKDSGTDFAKQLVQRVGGGSVHFWGWVDNPSDFYNSLSLYVQPSATEGFGIEVLEAMAHGRPVLCSRGAGAQDVVIDSMRFDPCNVDGLADAISAVRAGWQGESEQYQKVASEFTWSKVRQQYINLWREFS